MLVGEYWGKKGLEKRANIPFGLRISTTDVVGTLKEEKIDPKKEDKMMPPDGILPHDQDSFNHFSQEKIMV